MGTPSKAKPSKGTKLQRGQGDGPPETFVTIGEVRSFKGPGDHIGQIEVTNFDSVGKEFISDALPDGAEITLELNFVAGDLQQQGLRTDLRAGTLRNFKVVLNDNVSTPTTASFAAVVKDLDGPQAGQSEQYKLSVTLKVSGLASWTYAP